MRWPASRLLQNVSANMLGGVWTGLLIVLATPWFVSRLTLEGYGLVGFWLLLQVLLSLFDLGLGATIVREFADSSSEADGNQRRRELLRTFELVYGLVALVLMALLVVSAGWIARRWLQLQVFPQDQVASSIRLMAVSLALQYPGTLYFGGLAGLQRQGRMNLLQAAGNAARYGGGVAVLLWRPDPVFFFALQAVVAGVQTLAARILIWRMIDTPGSARPAFRLDVLQRVWRYSAGMAFTTVAALLLANIDRLYVSKFMAAEELGRYSLAFTATGLLQMGIQPFYRAYFPRFSELFALGNAERLRDEYFQGCRYVAWIVIPFGVIGWAFAPEIFAGWMGTADSTVVNIFRWLLVGIACAGLVWLPAAFQQAQGKTGLHAAMIAGAVVVGAPIMVWASRVYGTVGATAVWVVHGISGLTLELWLMHRSLLVGELLQWYRVVVLAPLLLTLPVVALSRWAMPAELGRWTNLSWVAATGVLVISIALVPEVMKRRASTPNAPV